MNQDTYFVPKIISLKQHPGLDERWVQDRLAENPKLLGLGELVIRDKERMQPGAGRLDLLLQDPETARRYEVEIQLGRTDESHIIRTIEYWDIEKKRYPQYDHCAVIVAEEITGRFLNVIALFNGFVPLIALRMQAVEVDGKVGLIFTKVLDEVRLGLVDEDEEIQELVDRSYWEQKGSPKTVVLVDRVFDLARDFAPEYHLKYNKHYIGLAINGQPNNFATFRPTKTALRFRVKLPKSQEMTDHLEANGFELLEYDHHYGFYKIRLSPEDVDSKGELLRDLMKEAFASNT